MFRTTVTDPITSINKVQRLNYEGDVKTLSHRNMGFNITFDTKTGMPMNVSIKPKAFCKVCHDAGKPENIYTSHFVRASPSQDAPVVCPTLLAQPCRYCSVPGHTVKYCPTLMKTQVNSFPKKEETTFVKPDVLQSPLTIKQDYLNSVNAFAALALSDDESHSSDDSDDDKEIIVNQLPKEDKLVEYTSSFDELNKLSKDALLSLLDAVLQLNPTSDNTLIISIEKALTKKEEASKPNLKIRPPFCSPRPNPMKPITQTQTVSKSWADYEDDEEMDFNVELNFPTLPPSASTNKRSYADMLKK